MRRSSILTFATAALAAAAVPALAQSPATTTATPDRAGAGTRLHVEVDTTQPPVAGRVPSGVTLAAQRGFRYDARAATRRCTIEQAQADECPQRSRIATATFLVHYETATTSGDLPVELTTYLRTDRRVLAVGSAGGRRAVVEGRIETDGGLRVVFDDLPDAPVIPGVSYEVRRLTADIGVSRRVAGVRRHLVRNPRRCPADRTWDSSGTLAFADGTTATVDAPIACRPERRG